jgi:hypothetical protein
MPKSATDIVRHGQSHGQILVRVLRFAAITDWLRLVREGTLDDPAFVCASRGAAKTPELWELVSPAAKEALFIPELHIRQLGGTRDDLLA